MAATPKSSQVAHAGNPVLVQRDVLDRKGDMHTVMTPSMDSDVSDQQFSCSGNQWGRGPRSTTLIAIRPKAEEKDQWGFLVTIKTICFSYAAGVPCSHQGKCNNYHAKLGSIMSDMPRRKPVVIAKIPSRMKEQARFSNVLEFNTSHKRKFIRMQKEEIERQARDEEDSDEISDDDPAAAFKRAAAIAAESRAAKRAKPSRPAESSHSAEPPPLPSAPTSIPVGSAATPPASSIPMGAMPAPEVEVAPPAPASTGTAGEGTPAEEEIVTA